VEAAEALRRIDRKPALRPLADALVASDDLGKITAAEAILVLQGDVK
jgi:hypothetical protein